MSNRRFIAFSTNRWGFVCFVAVLLYAVISAAQVPGPVPTQTPAADGVQSDTSISDAEVHFRTGVDLYNRNLFLEALSEFNRALALDPDMNNARIYRDKANAKLRLGAAGESASGTPAFDVVDATAIPSGAETPQLTAEEIKIQRVAELLSEGELYVENQMYSRAVKVFDEVLLIAPDNTRAREGLHKATIGASQEALEDTQKKVDEDHARARKFIEDSKLLPPGAGPDGVKPFRISVPYVEEQFEPLAKKSKIEELLDSPIGVEFEDIHISEIINFISENYDINIVIDDRAVLPPVEPAPTVAVQPGLGAPAGPGGMVPPTAAAPMATPRPPTAPTMVAPTAFPNAQTGIGRGPNQTQTSMRPASDGMVPYISLKDVPLRQALNALLRPLDLDFSVQPGFLWISKPDTIRLESFEELVTRYYELRNAGAETLYKIVVTNPSSGGGTAGGTGTTGGRSGAGGTTTGASGGTGTTGGTGAAGGGASVGGGGTTGGATTGGSRGGTTGGTGGTTSGAQISNISQLFGSISDLTVGETPAIVGTVGLSTGGTGGMGAGQQAGRPPTGGGQGAQLGSQGQANLNQEPEIVVLLRRLIPDVYEPGARERGEPPVSEMIYVPHNNQLIVRNTPTNLAELERQLDQIDITPKQVSIEAKFLTVSADDFKRIGFRWDVAQSDLNNRERQVLDDDDNPPADYQYDINGDGTDESIPFYTRPDGTSVIRNTISNAIMSAAASAGAIPAGTPGGFSLSGIITDNSDGDRVGVIFDYLNSLNESELLSAPRVTTMNRKPAVIVDLQSEYFVTHVESELTTAQAGFGGNAAIGLSQTITPEQFMFGITLSVTPQISGSDQVRLWLNPQVTSRGIEKTFTQRQIVDGTEVVDTFTMPNMSTQAVWTNVIVHDGDTLVLGGLVKDQTVKGRQKMPYLADIPVVGFFFRGKTHEVRQSSLLIFVTPTIIDTTGARFFEANMAPAKNPRPAAVAPENSGAPAATDNQYFEAEPLDGGVAPEAIVPETTAVTPVS